MAGEEISNTLYWYILVNYMYMYWYTTSILLNIIGKLRDDSRDETACHSLIPIPIPCRLGWEHVKDCHSP